MSKHQQIVEDAAIAAISALITHGYNKERIAEAIGRSLSCLLVSSDTLAIAVDDLVNGNAGAQWQYPAWSNTRERLGQYLEITGGYLQRNHAP